MRESRGAQAQQWAAADRLVTVALLRNAGKSYAEIGRTLNISTTRAKQLGQTAANSRAARWAWLHRMVSFNAHINERGRAT